jgi:hypothetical protein
LLVAAGADPRGQWLSVVVGVILVAAGVVVTSAPSQLPDELAIEEGFGTPLIVVGAIVALAALVLPVWSSDRVEERTDVRV